MTTTELITRIIGYIAGAMLGIWLYNNFSLEKILKKCGKRSNYEIKDSEMKEIDDDEVKNLLEPIAKKLHVGKIKGLRMQVVPNEEYMINLIAIHKDGREMTTKVHIKELCSDDEIIMSKIRKELGIC